MSNTPVIDSPEALGAALCRHVPDMSKGFTLQTRHGDIYVTADDAAPFAGAMERLLLRKIAQIQDEQRGPNSDAQCYPIHTPSTAAQLERNLATIEENDRLIRELGGKPSDEAIHKLKRLIRKNTAREQKADAQGLTHDEARTVTAALVKLLRRLDRRPSGMFDALSILHARGFLGPVSATPNTVNGVILPKSASERINEIWEAALQTPTTSPASRQAVPQAPDDHSDQCSWDQAGQQPRGENQ
ncbi:hypothetical protein VSX61_08675 [Brenneria populi subsp. brevivirga]|uniref:hypothetical protein n=1 Tax=Brenneria populi TaxID=1505588 RepID=UPI002E171027|nr:hypothetical protein [Brenneria populi subsp. brevivirga]